MIDVREADRILQGRRPLLSVEECPLEEAVGRFLRDDIRADRDQPPYDRVAMDGVALSAAAVASGVRRFRVQATQAAGDPPLTLSSSDACIEVMTGGVLPGGCDTVVGAEDVQRDGAVAVLRPEKAPAQSAHVHRKGADCVAGDVVVAGGTRLSPAHVAIAAAMGRVTVRVSARPRVAVVSTGDELVDVAEEPKGHQVRSSNGHGIQAALRGAGFGEPTLFHVPDQARAMERELTGILDRFHVVVLSGGVSKGPFDLVPGVLTRLGVECHLHGVRQRPGKPLWFGTRDPLPVFALPGNPVSALVCLYRYVLPYLVGASSGVREARRVQLSADARTKPGLTHFVPVSLCEQGGGLLAAPVPTNGSGDLMGLARSDGFVELASTGRAAAGDVVPFYPWRST